MSPRINIRTIEAGCPICRKNSSEPHGAGQDFEYRTTGDTEWKFRICSDCGTIFLSPRPDQTELSLIYPNNYYAYDFTAKQSLGYRVKTLVDRIGARSYLRLMAKHGKILDIGCGDGRLLSVFLKLGIRREDLHGLEINKTAAERARRLGFNVQALPFEKASFSEKSFELIILQQVIEHVPDPAAMLTRIRSLLSPGGCVIIETPNVASWDHAIFFRRYWGGYHIPRHFFLFNPRSLALLLKKSGLEVQKVDYLVSPSFWTQSVHHWLVEHRYPECLRKMFHPQVPSALALSFFTALDLFGKFLKLTSNMRVVARRV